MKAMNKIRFARSGDGTRIAYEVHGDGTPILLLHGFSDSRTSWTTAGYTDDLVSRGHLLVLVDARGHGESDRPIDPRAYSGRAMLADLSAVLDALQLPQAAAMGFSMGGVAALAAAAFLPERIASVVAIGAHPYAEDLSWLRELFSAGVSGWIEAIEANVGGLDPDTRRRMTANDPAALRAAIATDRTDFSEAFAASGRPILAILGDSDPRCEATGEMRKIPGVEVLSLAGADHFGSFFAARNALPEIAAFLTQTMQEAR
ncbi:alpha/beta fold hydrolase [Jannaschia formosa]|uniref:alpha/beta fold hydrolase n=1 Tax=Jannaschia formosa TaxID=2259592 RepID=UPI000E1C18DF|nr:alpha/beta fold hydrolase [Jannaschia formosa]TFL16342.1 alpha/beta fold hydrolase [Jannaschia formosa]